MDNPQRRHDISDEAWALIEPHLPGQRGQWGGIAKDNRLFINAVFWILRTGAPWRDLPPEYGKWGTVHQRFIRWRDKRIWERLLEITPVRLRSKKNSPKNPVLCYKDFTQRLNTKGKFGLCRILTHCSPKR